MIRALVALGGSTSAAAERVEEVEFDAAHCGGAVLPRLGRIDHNPGLATAPKLFTIREFTEKLTATGSNATTNESTRSS
jgi:hypothetical protein